MGIDRYFKVGRGSANAMGMTAVLMPDGDVLPLDVLQNAAVVYQGADFTVIKIRITDDVIDEMVYQTGLENPLTIEGVSILEIESAYLGTTLDDVENAIPELKNKIIDIVWA